ncbi:hypothetical protein [Flammeovirga sp. SubArs3]|uniref:hypothetical protein n=1 Tax=Flammeovirga sp. SubArs3 TaxID=2995316 RepID=UPI00248B6349|nr:hypothetical protein [Flammeovirga sp. SubArs3]
MKLINYFRLFILTLFLILYYISFFTNIHLEYKEIIFLVIGLIYILLTVFSIIKIKTYEPEDYNFLYPYHSLFIGVNQWFYSLSYLLIGVLNVFNGYIYFGSFLSIFSITFIIERLIKNKRMIFNVEFNSEKLVINEDINREIFYSKIEDIQIINSKKIKIITSEDKDVIMNTNRIRRDHRDKFKSQLLNLKK